MPDNQATSAINIYYRTENMDLPKLFYQKCTGALDGYVACMAQFLPTMVAQNHQKDPSTEFSVETPLSQPPLDEKIEDMVS